MEQETRRFQDRDIRFLKPTIPLGRHHGDERALVLEHGDLGYFGDVAIAPSKSAATTFLPPPACAVIDCLQSFAPDSPVERKGIELSVPGAESITKRNRVLRENCPPNQLKNNAAALS